MLLVFGAPCQLRSLAGQEHGRTIPLADMALAWATSQLLGLGNISKGDMRNAITYDDPCRLHEQNPQVAIAALGYLAQDGAVPSRDLFGDEPKPGGKVAAFRIKPKSWERHGLKPWIEAANKRLHRNVLAIALANKLARIAWSVLARGRAFEVRKVDSRHRYRQELNPHCWP